MTAANALAAFIVLPQLIADGHINRTEDDLTERSDFLVLYEHVDNLENDTNFLEYVEDLGQDQAARIAEASMTFFNSFINDKVAIPMDQAEKAKLVKMLTESYAGNKTN